MECVVDLVETSRWDLSTQKNRADGDTNPTTSKCPRRGGNEPPETGIHTWVPWS